MKHCILFLTIILQTSAYVLQPTILKRTSNIINGLGQSICKSNEFQCKSGVCNRKGCKGKPCIPIEWVNDDPENPDCTDGSDEESKFQNRTINPNIESVTSMAIDETGTFLYYTQCCECVISRVNIKEKGIAEPKVIYSETGKVCYNLAIVGDKLLFSVSYDNTTYRQQQGLDGKWNPVPWSSPQVDSSLRWRWAHRPTASIKQIDLGNSIIQDPVIFKHGLYPITFFTTSPAQPNILYVGFEGSTYAPKGSKVVRYNMVTKEQNTILKDINVEGAMIVDDFIIYTTLGNTSPGNTGKLYRKPLGSNEEATLVASQLAASDTISQTKNEILVNGLGYDGSPSLQQAVVSFSTDSVLSTNEEIKPKVVKDGIQSNAMACTLSGTVYYAGYRNYKGIYETYSKTNQ